MWVFDLFIGWLSGILDGIYGLTASMGIPSYAIAIVVFTVIIRVLIAPLFWKQQVGMRKMQELQPILARLQKKYANNKELYNQKMMELYQRRKVNPMSGCLPILVQLPIIICFYRMLINHTYPDIEGVAMPGTHFFGYSMDDKEWFSWGEPLTYILPVFVAVSYFIATKIQTSINTSRNAAGKDENDEKPSLFDRILIFFKLKKEEENKGKGKGKGKSKAKAKEPEPAKNPLQSQMKLMNPLMSAMMAYITVITPVGMSLYFFATAVMMVVQAVVFNKIMDMQKKKDREKSDHAEIVET